MAKSKMYNLEGKAQKEFRLALYVRVSTDRQAEEGYSIEVQKEKLLAFSKTLDGKVSHEFFIDDGYSGSSLARPAMEKLIAMAKKGGFSHVCVYKLDRLSRSQKDTLFLIEDIFLPQGIAFVSVQESFNTATAFGRAVVGILSVFAQLERENIYERTRSGMIKRVEQGFWIGGGGTPFGYDYHKDKGILVKNKDAKTVEMVYKLYLEGQSLQKIANRLGLKYEKFAQQILERKTNMGIIEYRGKEYVGQHEPIVSKETFYKAMDLKNMRREKRMSPQAMHLLTGLVYCKNCGAKMRYQKWGKRGYKLVCYSKQKDKPYLIRDENCQNVSPFAEGIEAAVINDIFAITKKDLSSSKSSTKKSILELLETRKKEIEHKLKRLYNLYSQSDDEILIESINQLKRELESIKEKQEEEEKRGSVSKIAQDAKKKLLSLESTWELLSIEEKRMIISSLIEKIIVGENSLEIDFKF